MKHVQKSVLLWYSPREMYALVTNVQDYPKFLPWCDRAEVLQTHDDGVTARLHIAFAGVRQAFTTRNVNVDAEQVVMKLVDGPFSKLEGVWKFIPLQAPGQTAQGIQPVIPGRRGKRGGKAGRGGGHVIQESQGRIFSPHHSTSSGL